MIKSSETSTSNDSIECVGKFFCGGFYEETGRNRAKTFCDELDKHEIVYEKSRENNDILIHVNNDQLKRMKKLNIERTLFNEPRR